MLTKRSKLLRREQLDRALSQPMALQQIVLPKRGWIREVREALGLTALQLASRMGVSQPTVANLEHSEARGAITLASLKKAAEAMGCRLTYAFVPCTSLEDVIQKRATGAAVRLLARVDHTMSLEAQSADAEFRARRVRELTDELVRTLSRELWEENLATPKVPRVGEGAE
jgi:predicted DNA-binding mobile mystery protein A